MTCWATIAVTSPTTSASVLWSAASQSGPTVTCLNRWLALCVCGIFVDEFDWRLVSLCFTARWGPSGPRLPLPAQVLQTSALPFLDGRRIRCNNYAVMLEGTSFTWLSRRDSQLRELKTFLAVIAYMPSLSWIVRQSVNDTVQTCETRACSVQTACRVMNSRIIMEYWVRSVHVVHLFLPMKCPKVRFSHWSRRLWNRQGTASQAHWSHGMSCQVVLAVSHRHDVQDRICQPPLR